MKKKSKMYYFLGLLFSTFVPVAYIFFSTGVWEDGLTVTKESLSTGFVIGIGIIVFVLIKDFYRKANDPDNTNYKQRALGRALFRLTPWIVAIVLAFATYNGIANIYRHVLVFSSCQVVASVFIGMEQYYLLLERKKFNQEG